MGFRPAYQGRVCREWSCGRSHRASLRGWRQVSAAAGTRVVPHASGRAWRGTSLGWSISPASSPGTSTRRSSADVRIRWLFLLTWVNFVWMFVSVLPLLPGSPSRTLKEWLIRGLVSGFVAATAGALIERRRRAKVEPVMLTDEELQATAAQNSSVE